MADSFKVGEMASLVLAPGQIPLDCWIPYIGQDVEIISPLRQRSFKGVKAMAYVVRSADGRKFGVEPPNLQKKRLPPPRQELGEWELCPWKPGLPQTVS